MPKIFISYRREDTGHQAGRLMTTLVHHFGTEQIFRDKESIPPAANWRDEVRETLTGDMIVLALIGKTWVSATDASGQRVLESPRSNNRLELDAALRLKLKTIPLLVDGADVPKEHELPESLRDLLTINALRLRDDDWESDAKEVIKTLESFGVRSVGGHQPARRRWLSGLMPWLAGLALVVLVGIVVMFVTFGQRSAPAMPNPSPAPVIPQPPVASTPSPEPVAVASPPEPPPSLHIEIVIDTSEGMNAAFDGRTKLAAAIAALHPMPYFENDNLALRKFGGECRKDDSSQLVVKFGRKIQKQIEASAEGLQPSGHPSLISGIEAAITDLESLRDAPKRIVVVTGGDFCSDEDFSVINLRLKAAKPDPTELDIRVIGIGLSKESEQRLWALVEDVGGLAVVKTVTELNREVQWALELDPAAKPLLRDLYRIVDALNGTGATISEVAGSLNARNFEQAPLRVNTAQTSLDKTNEIFAAKNRLPATYQLYWKTAMERRSSQARLLEIARELMRYGQVPGGPNRSPTVDLWNDAIGRYMNVQYSHNAIVEQLEVIAQKARQEARRKRSVADRQSVTHAVQ